MKPTLGSPHRIAFVLMFIVLPLTALVCTWNPSPSEGNGPTATPSSTSTPRDLLISQGGNGTVPAPSPTSTAEDPLTVESRDWTLDLELDTKEEGQIADPFKISIPLEKIPGGLAGSATGIHHETCLSGGERTTKETLDVIATGEDPLTFTVTWNASVLSSSGICFGGIPPDATVVDDPFELPARDGASKTIHETYIGGEYTETYTLRLK